MVRKVLISLTIPQGDDFYYNDLSLLIDGLKFPDKAGVTAGANVNALSWARSGDSLLVNAGFNPLSVERAERYVSRFEASRLAGDRDDAAYFTAQLRQELRAPLQARLEKVAVRKPLVIEELAVGKVTDDGKTWALPVTFRSNRVPSEYKLLSQREHTRTPWQVYSPDTPLALKVRITTNETQDIFLILRDAENTSSMLASTVKLAEHR